MNIIPKDEPEYIILEFCIKQYLKMINKYRKGKKEHGGNWREVDCKKEIAQEVLDILIYDCMEKAKG